MPLTQPVPFIADIALSGNIESPFGGPITPPVYPYVSQLIENNGGVVFNGAASARLRLENIAGIASLTAVSLPIEFQQGDADATTFTITLYQRGTNTVVGTPFTLVANAPIDDTGSPRTVTFSGLNLVNVPDVGFSNDGGPWTFGNITSPGVTLTYTASSSINRRQRALHFPGL